MIDKDKVKVVLYTKNCGSFTTIMSLEAAYIAQEEWQSSLVDGKINICGRLNDIDANKVSMSFDCEEVVVFEIVEANHTF